MNQKKLLCRLPDCGRVMGSKGFCHSHYDKWAKGNLIYDRDHWVDITKLSEDEKRVIREWAKPVQS